jgi:hypothetical protein
METWVLFICARESAIQISQTSEKDVNEQISRKERKTESRGKKTWNGKLY